MTGVKPQPEKLRTSKKERTGKVFRLRASKKQKNWSSSSKKPKPGHTSKE